MQIERVHHVVGRLLWRSLLVVLIFLAVYVSGVRLLLSTLPMYKDAILQSVSGQLGSGMTLSALEGDLVGFTPAIRLEGLKLPASEALAIRVLEARASIDPWASLLALSPRLGTLFVEQAEVDIDLGKYQSPSSFESAAVVISPFAVFNDIVVSNASVTLTRDDFVSKVFRADLRIVRDGSNLQFKGEATGPGGSRFSLSGAGVGQLTALDRFEGSIYGRLIVPEIATLSEALKVNLAGNADVEFWYQNTSGQRQVTVKPAVSDLLLEGFNNRSVRLDHGSFVARASSAEKDWQITVEGLEIERDSANFTLGKAQLQIAGPSVTAYLSGFDVAAAAGVIVDSGLLPRNVQSVVSALGPSGIASGAWLQLADLEHPRDSWSAAVEVRNATVQPFKKAPGLYGIDATVNASKSGATAWIDTEGFGLDLPLVYDRPIVVDRIKGQLKASWQKDLLLLHDGVLMAETDIHPAAVRFAMDIPLNAVAAKETPVAMYLDVAFSGAPLAVRNNYIPKKIPSALDQWLHSALLAGDVEQGIFLWRGPFNNFGAGTQSMQLAADISDATIQYQPDWPESITPHARLFVDTQDVALWSEEAASEHVLLQDLVLMTHRSAKKHELAVSTRLKSGAQDALTFLSNSPINKKAGRLLADLEAQGNVTGSLTLNLDLNNLANNVDVNLTTDLSDVAVRSRLLGAGFTAVSGGLDFDWVDGFTSRTLSAALFDKPVSITIGPGETGRENGDLVDARFMADIKGIELQSWLQTNGLLFDHVALDQLFVGETAVTVDLIVGASADVYIETDLADLAIQLPEPIGKRADEATVLELQLNLSEHGNWQVFWKDRLQALVIREGGDFTGAVVDITPRDTPDFGVYDEEPRRTSGVLIAGARQELVLDPWINFYTALKGESTKVRSVSWPAIDELAVEKVAFRDASAGPLLISASRADAWYEVMFSLPNINGVMAFPFEDDPPELVIHELHLGDSAAEASADAREPESVSVPQADTVEEIAEEVVVATQSPPTLSSPINVAVANIYMKSQRLGAVTFTLGSSDKGLGVTDLRGNIAAASLIEGSALSWERHEEASWQSQFSGGFLLRDIADGFQKFSVEPAVRSTAGEVDLDISWPGSPADMALDQLSGRVEISLEDGSFLPVSGGATGVVRLFGLLNLADLVERANVNQLFEPGVAFATAQGQLDFSTGDLAIPDFSIDGPGGAFSFSSDIDLKADAIEGELVVTLPLIDNIPWVAALAGGLPLAAGAYLMSRVFEDQVKSLSSGVYNVTGSLSDPEVKFVRLFDASSVKNRSNQTSGETQEPSSSLK